MVRLLANYGSERKYVFTHIGRNSRIDELHAATLCVKLPHLNYDNRLRRNNALRYIQGISNDMVRVPGMDYWHNSVFHLMPVMCPERDRLQQYLADNGVITEIHYPIPPHKQQCYEAWNNLKLPITEVIHREELSLPVSPATSPEEVDEVIRLIYNFR